MTSGDKNIFIGMAFVTIFLWVIATGLILYEPRSPEPTPFIYKSDYKPTGSWNITQHKRLGLYKEN